MNMSLTDVFHRALKPTNNGQLTLTLSNKLAILKYNNMYRLFTPCSQNKAVERSLASSVLMHGY